MPMIDMPFAAPTDFVGAVQAPPTTPDAALWFVFREARLMVGEGTFELPRSPLGLLASEPLYFGTLGTTHLYACEVGRDAQAPPDWRWSDLRSLFSQVDDRLFALAGRALQLVDWDRTHRYCGRCGSPTRARTHERARECPSCGTVAFPRLAPATMVLVRRPPDEILLARSPRFPPGMYSALAGFVEPGETLEQCLEREVLEEVGVRVRNVRYVASQPWPFPHSLMIAFIADWAGGEISVDLLEIEAAAWFKIRNLPQLPQPISIARRLIDTAVAEMLHGFRSGIR